MAGKTVEGLIPSPTAINKKGRKQCIIKHTDQNTLKKL